MNPEESRRSRATRRVVDRDTTSGEGMSFRTSSPPCVRHAVGAIAEEQRHHPRSRSLGQSAREIGRTKVTGRRERLRSAAKIDQVDRDIASHQIHDRGRGRSAPRTGEGVRLAPRPGSPAHPLDRHSGSGFLYRSTARREYKPVQPPRVFIGRSRPAFRRAVTALVERHAVLRTRFSDVCGEPRQLIERQWRRCATLRSEQCQLEALRQLVAEAQRRERERAVRPRARVPAANANPATAAARAHRARTVHHIIWDGLSLRPFKTIWPPSTTPSSLARNHCCPRSPCSCRVRCLAARYA